MALRLRVGFPTDVPETEATALAVQDWRDACADAGGDNSEAPSTTVIRDDPERVAMGEYVVQVDGGCNGRRQS